MIDPSDINGPKKAKDAEDLSNARASLDHKWYERCFRAPAHEIEPLKRLLLLLAVPGGPREARRVVEAGDPLRLYRAEAIATVLNFAETFHAAKRGANPEPVIPTRRKAQTQSEPAGIASDKSKEETPHFASNPPSAPGTEQIEPAAHGLQQNEEPASPVEPATEEATTPESLSAPKGEPGLGQLDLGLRFEEKEGAQ